MRNGRLWGVDVWLQYGLLWAATNAAFIQDKRNLSLSGYSSEYGTHSAQTSSESPITPVNQSMQNAAAEVLPDLDPEDTLSFHKDDTSGASTLPLARSTKKESNSASALAHYECGVSSPSRRGQVWHDKKEDARPGKSFELGYGVDSPSKNSCNADPEQPGPPVRKSTANTSFSSCPFDHGRIFETEKRRHRKKGMQSTYKEFAEMIPDISPLGLSVPLWF